jgi:hypothetical protein
MSSTIHDLARIIHELSHTPPSACPHCNGLGVAIREDARGRLFEWPCVNECAAPVITATVNRRIR